MSVQALLLEKKPMLKRLVGGEELLEVLVWRSGSCISACKGLFGKHDWFEISGMNNGDGEGIGWPKEQLVFGDGGS